MDPVDLEKLFKILEDRAESKSTDKLIAVVAGFSQIPWDKVGSLKLTWDDSPTSGPLPNLTLEMK